VLGDVMVGDRPAVLRWQTLKMISNAIRMIDSNGRDAEIALGGKHKVRNFFNNLFNPSDASSVTIDTHAVAAALLQPFGGSSLEVAHNFANDPPRDPVTNKMLAPPAPESDVTGMRGTYGLYAEAYRQAAAERGILPRQMQSITWEASRGLFTLKSDKQKDLINAIWQRYRRGHISLEAARAEVFNAAGGINAPEWAAGSGAGINAAPGYPAHQAELPAAQLYGPGAAAALGGGGIGSAAGNPPAQTLSTEAQSVLAAPRGVEAYHGTATKFTNFDAYFLGSVTGTSDAAEGFWFSGSMQRAYDAARDANAMTGTNVPYVMTRRLNLQNPKIVRSIRGRDPENVAKLAQQAKRAGHDGIVFEKGEGDGPDYLVFDPTKITE